jgi:hypothetical protein
MFMGEHRDEILIRNSAALGEYDSYKRLLELDHAQLVEVLKDEE